MGKTWSLSRSFANSFATLRPKFPSKQKAFFVALLIMHTSLLTGCLFATADLSNLSVAPRLAVTIESGNVGTVPLVIEGGSPPYTARIIEGAAEINPSDNSLIATIPGQVKVEVEDATGQVVTVDVTVSGNLSILQSAPTSFVASSDFTKLYFVKANSDGDYEIFRVNTDGTASTKMIASGTSVSGTTIKTVGSFALSPNEQKIVFTGTDASFFRRLYSADIDGTNIVLLSGTYTVSAQGVQDFKIVSNTRVVYTDGEQEPVAGDVEQWMRTVNLDGTSRQLVHPSMSNFDGAQVWMFKFTTDLSRVFYFSEPTFADITRLYVADTDGSDNGSFLPVSLPGVDHWVGQTSGITISSDNSRVAISRNGAPNSAYVCAADGTGCINHSDHYMPYAFSSDDDFLLSYQSSFTNIALISATTTDSMALGTTAAGQYYFVAGSNFVYRTTAGVPNRIERTAQVIGADFPAWTQLTPVFGAHAGISSVTLSSDNQKVYFIADDQTDKVFRLHKMDIGGANYTAFPQASFDLTAGIIVPTILKISADQKRAVIRVSQDLYVVNLDSGLMWKATDRTESTSTLSYISLLDDAKKIFYLSNQNQLTVTEIFKVLIPF